MSKGKSIFLIILISVSLCGCSTIAKSYEKNGVKYLEIRGIGKAKFDNNAEIEGKPMIQFPQLPDLKYES